MSCEVAAESAESERLFTLVDSQRKISDRSEEGINEVEKDLRRTQALWKVECEK
jgi:hypothetical protein